ncbi:hypothetical protein VE01_07791 [Pseudogymnoascus verrucosus]|uniref:Hemerythrin-like domain-containing protein n=1 Tax=Pseudogymnoascus verrucosus TaxID=342668 RepID=A0A1B8GEI6_9PEZI|nr:uncharacterized protein VE01_07791 [Pseudogymnoascus verrucosus]OBT94246.1 hypothetical protein VE01_07791 [Pseudogymnoascus verrucosus]
MAPSQPPPKAVNDDPPFTLLTSTGRASYPSSSTHQCAFMASIMGEFDNCVLRALNSAYRHSFTTPPSRDAADLLRYSLTICSMIAAHHDWEENSYFPALDALAGQPGILASNIVEHHEFEDGLTAFQAYCEATTGDGFSGEEFRARMRAFAPPLERHLSGEPETFYRLRELGSGALLEVYREQEKIALAKGDMWLIMPLVLRCEDKTYDIDGRKEHTHAFPWILPYLAHYIFSWRYARLWRFNPCDFWGNPLKLKGE